MTSARDTTRPHGREYLGKGLALPLTVTANGRMARASGAAKVEQSIAMILGTPKGTRVMRPEVGTEAHDRVFAPNDPATAVQIAEDVRAALSENEPRIVVLDVTTEQSESMPSLLLIRIDYREQGNNTIANLVYPFFITEGL